MAHRYTPEDVERALTRYRDLTGDTAAELTRERVPNSFNPNVFVFRVVKSKRLRGFELHGAFSAFTALEMYCNGFEDGLAEGRKKTA